MGEQKLYCSKEVISKVNLNPQEQMKEIRHDNKKVNATYSIGIAILALL